MANIEHITKGQPDWDKTANNNFDTLGQAADSTTDWSAYTDLGISVVNGAIVYNDIEVGTPQYRTRKIGGHMDVQLRFYLKGITKVGDTAYVNLPKNIFGNMFRIITASSTAGRTATWRLEDSQMKLHATSDNQPQADHWFPMNIVLTL